MVKNDIPSKVLFSLHNLNVLKAKKNLKITIMLMG